MKKVNTTSSPSRRKLLKSLAGAGGAFVAAKSIPGEWTKPVVDSVILPVHAQTSPDQGTEPRFVVASGTVTQDIGTAPAPGTNRLVKLLNNIVPRAEAAVLPDYYYYICVKPASDGKTANVQVFQLSPPEIECEEGRVGEKRWYTAADVPVAGSIPSTLTGGNDVCSSGNLDALLDSFSLIRSAHASAATIQLDSVENGASGTINFGAEIKFSIGPGTCSPPECCDGASNQLEE